MGDASQISQVPVTRSSSLSSARKGRWNGEREQSEHGEAR
jgi:hypothetical protein